VRVKINQVLTRNEAREVGQMVDHVEADPKREEDLWSESMLAQFTCIMKRAKNRLSGFPRPMLLPCDSLHIRTAPSKSQQ
jgi:hypothetical protein